MIKCVRHGCSTKHSRNQPYLTSEGIGVGLLLGLFVGFGVTELNNSSSCLSSSLMTSNSLSNDIIFLPGCGSSDGFVDSTAPLTLPMEEATIDSHRRIGLETSISIGVYAKNEYGSSLLVLHFG